MLRQTGQASVSGMGGAENGEWIEGLHGGGALLGSPEGLIVE